MYFIKFDYMFINLKNIDYIEFEDDEFCINFYFNNEDSNIFYSCENDCNSYIDLKRYVIKELIRLSLFDKEVQNELF